jgi:hypothetical protein
MIRSARKSRGFSRRSTAVVVELRPDGGFTYRARAYNGAGDGAYVTFAAVTPVAAPSNVAAALSADGTKVVLRWQDNSDNEQNFEVQRQATVTGQPAGAWSTVGTVGADVRTYETTDVPPVGASNTYYA